MHALSFQVIQPGELEQQEVTHPTESDDVECAEAQAEEDTMSAAEMLQQHTGENRITEGTMSLHGIRADQLCEILSREIGRVREESVQQAQDMRMQYEREL